MLLMLSQPACLHIAYLCNERSWRDTGLLRPADAEELRLTFVRAALKDNGPVLLELAREQVRALDMLLTDADPRDGKLPDGTPVLALVETIWRVLIGEGDAGYQDDHHDPLTRTDAGAPLRRS